MKRNFCIGSEWLYYKVYSGFQTADVILLEKIKPIMVNLKAERLITKWFFIRYKDPHEHFRLRFYSEIPANLAIVVARLYPVLNELLEQDVVWKVQTDTYQRELERYGENTIEDSETFFWLDSETMLDYLSIKNDFVNEKMQFLFSFLAIDNFLDAFSLTNIQKLRLLDDLQSIFKKEFDADKILRKEMDKHFRLIKDDIQFFLNRTARNNYPEIFNVIEKNQERIFTVANSVKKQLEIPLEGFLISHIHMMINRQYTSKQRQYELIIYDHLHRYYKTVENKSEFVKEKLFFESTTM